MAKDDEDPGFEVVEPKPLRKPVIAKAIVVKPVTKKPAISEDPGFEVVDSPPPKKKAVVRAVADEDEEEEEDRPRKKKKRKLDDTRNDRRELDRGFFEENTPGLIALALGLLMLIAGAAGVARHQENQWNQLLTIILVVLSQLIAIPVTVGALFVIGSLFGIEYGSFGSGVLNLAAMTFFVNGVSWMCDWFKIPGFIYSTALFILTVGLFIALMRLDIWETMITMFCLNLISWVLNIVINVLLALMLVNAVNVGSGGGSGGGGGGGIGNVDVDDDDDWDPEDGPRPPKRNQIKGKQGKQAQPQRPPVVDPDD